VTSNRDFEIHGDDLVVATHGRGFWVIDDISPLRQVNDTVLRADAHLFRPADAVNVLQGGDNGTPTQKDEPQTPNPPNGAAIDYYLRTAPSGPVTIEVMDANGATVARFSTEGGAQPDAAAGRGGRGGGGGIPNTSALWRPTPEAFSGAAGMHRVIWTPVAPAAAGAGGRGRGGGGGGRGGGAAMLTGTFTAKLTVNGQSYTQTFAVKPDPRSRDR